MMMFRAHDALLLYYSPSMLHYVSITHIHPLLHYPLPYCITLLPITILYYCITLTGYYLIPYYSISISSRIRPRIISHNTITYSLYSLVISRRKINQLFSILPYMTVNPIMEHYPSIQ